ncbi:MAG: dihydropteroate synthase [Comamonadaceae bacterium]|nr:dihydropteroate synthase [Comamonadaceae bacterium]
MLSAQRAHDASPRCIWRTARYEIALEQPQVMGIINITPDSFSDGGVHADTRAALQHAERLLEEGAAILDVGAESTRPGSAVVPQEEEWRRLQPVLRELVQWGAPISVDTYKANTMRAALDLGADIINDVWALRQPGAVEAVARHPQCGVCLMHMHGEPQTMQLAPMHGDVPSQVLAFLQERMQALLNEGVARQRIVFDPGIGFGKTVQQNFALLAAQQDWQPLGLSWLVGWSRKSSLGAITGREVGQRQSASVAAAVLAVQQGARVVRVHDVAATVDALKVWQAMEDARAARNATF